VLVYLDSAHLALLERATPADATTFWSAWTASNCELSISLYHLQEVGQLANRANAERRLRVLEEFPVIRSGGVGSAHVISMEIQLQIAQSAGYRVEIQKTARQTLFPVTNLTQLMSSLGFQDIFHQMRAAYGLGADAANISKEGARQKPLLDPTAPIDPETFNSPETKAAMEAALAELPSDAAVLMRQLYEQVSATLIEHGSVRTGLEAIFGLQNVAMRDRIPHSDLAAVSVFFNTARAEKSASLCSKIGLTEAQCEQLVDQLNPYAAPGFALQLAAQRARQLHPKPDEPGDEVDVGHLAFAPYVDLAFVDKRTLGFIVQEARDRPHLLAPEFTKNIVRAGTLEQVARAIQSATS
jgi:hypothetical protein